MKQYIRWCLAATVTFSAVAASAHARPQLKLELTGSPGPVAPGGLVQVKISMAQLGGQEAAGFQAFLEFDPTELQFVNGSYTSAPFGLAIINPIVASGNQIDLAAGINQFAGQLPSSADATLAFLTFTSPNGTCHPQSVQFRPHDPPTRITTLVGAEIVPLTLLNIPPLPVTCAADTNYDHVVDVSDLLHVINTWGPCPLQPACCPGDIVADEVVNVSDLLAVINAWGPCP